VTSTYQSSTEYLLADTNLNVLTIHLNRPDALNAFRPEMLTGIAELLEQANTDTNISVVVLEGAGRAFSAGVDLKVLRGIEPQAGKIGDVFNQPARRAYTAIRNASCPVIAKVHGACFTGALEMALHCDFIFTTVDAKFGDTHAKFGLRPTWGMSQTLSQAIGVRKAKEISFTGRTFLGSEAVSMGLANQAAADKNALDALVAECAAAIARNSRPTVAAVKDLYALAQGNLSIEEALAAELERNYPDINDTQERLAGFGG